MNFSQASVSGHQTSLLTCLWLHYFHPDSVSIGETFLSTVDNVLELRGSAPCDRER